MTKLENEMLKILKELEWARPVYDDPHCEICFNQPYEGHTDNCRLAKLIKEIEGL